MDIHRCRFVPYQPQSINALAFSHNNSKQRTPTDLRLALGRENGDVEIWNPNGGNWVQEKILRGSHGRTIEQLVWTQDLVVDEDNTERPIDDGRLRLFSSGGSTSITEWDLTMGTPKRHAEGNFGEIWCFAAQPQWRASLKYQEMSKVATSPSQLLAAGCSDGTVVLFSTADDDLQYMRTIAQSSGKKSKVISITWKDRGTIITGYENGQIKVIDVEKRSVIRTMSLGKPADGTFIVVWTVKCLPDGTLLSGDSTGELKVWDAMNYSLVQRLKTHEADILDLAVSAKGDLIFTAGVDRRTVAYRPLLTEKSKRRERWQQVMHRRFHQHDVKAMATFESKEMSVLVSGGMDTVPIVMPLKNFDLEYHRSLPHLPQKPQMSCSAKKKLMLTWWNQDLLLWDLPLRGHLLNGNVVAQSDSPEYRLLARIQLGGDENITSAEISSHGQMIVAATTTGVKLFQLRERDSHGEREIRARPVDLPIGIGKFGGTIAGFSPDSHWLYVVRSNNVIALVKITTSIDSKQPLQVQRRVIKLARKMRKVNSGKLGDYRQSINCLSFSADSRIIATGDLSGSIDVWILEGHENTNQEAHTGNRSESSENESESETDSDDETDTATIDGQKWIRSPFGAQLPQLESGLIALSFKPSSSPPAPAKGDVVGLHATRQNPHPVSREHPTAAHLLAVTSQHNVVEFDVLLCKLSDWSRRNPSTYLPNKFTQLKDRVMGLFWDCATEYQRLYLYGSGFLFMIDMSCDLSLVDAQEAVGQIGKYIVREALPENAEQQSAAPDENFAIKVNKRKRKRNGGAGDTIKQGEWLNRDAIISTTREHETNATIANDADFDTGLLSPISKASDDNDMEVDLQDSNLATFRRKLESSHLKGTSKSQIHEERKPMSVSMGPSHFATFRYRSIFGVVSLKPIDQPKQDDTLTADIVQDANISSSHQSTADPELEVVIVERPLYDVELLPRFEGGQDWGS